MWSADYVCQWGEIATLAQEVAEQTAIIRELKEWEEAADRHEAAREETLVLLNRDIERCKRLKLQELKREWDGKRLNTDIDRLLNKMQVGKRSAPTPVPASSLPVPDYRAPNILLDQTNFPTGRSRSESLI